MHSFESRCLTSSHQPYKTQYLHTRCFNRVYEALDVPLAECLCDVFCKVTIVGVVANAASLPPQPFHGHRGHRGHHEYFSGNPRLAQRRRDSFNGSQLHEDRKTRTLTQISYPRLLPMSSPIHSRRPPTFPHPQLPLLQSLLLRHLPPIQTSLGI